MIAEYQEWIIRRKGPESRVDSSSELNGTKCLDINHSRSMLNIQLLQLKANVWRGQEANSIIQCCHCTDTVRPPGALGQVAETMDVMTTSIVDCGPFIQVYTEPFLNQRNHERTHLASAYILSHTSPCLQSRPVSDQWPLLSQWPDVGGRKPQLRQLLRRKSEIRQYVFDQYMILSPPSSSSRKAEYSVCSS
jgi:hypothetical protein